MKTEPGTDLQSGGNLIFDWISRFGFATVCATILLAYVLWSSYSLSTAVLPSLERVVASQERMAIAQQETAALLRSIQLDLVRSCTASAKGG